MNVEMTVGPVVTAVVAMTDVTERNVAMIVAEVETMATSRDRRYDRRDDRDRRYDRLGASGTDSPLNYRYGDPYPQREWRGPSHDSYKDNLRGHGIDHGRRSRSCDAQWTLLVSLWKLAAREF